MCMSEALDYKANAQPCDQLHGYWRSLTDVYEDVALGFTDSPLQRQAIEDILMDEVGPLK